MISDKVLHLPDSFCFKSEEKEESQFWSFVRDRKQTIYY